MSQRLVVNFIKCDAHGICSQLFPEGIRLDAWGYPIIEPGPISPALLAHARRAVVACPAVALMLVKAERS
jgi:ferredoxin